MSLRNRALERAVRPRIRDYDARRQMGFFERLAYWLESTPVVGTSHVRWAATVVWTLIMLERFGGPLGTPLVLSFVAIWSLGAAAARAAITREIAIYDPAYLTLWLLPLPADAIFRRKVRDLMRGSVWLLFEFALAYWLVAGGANASIGGSALAMLCAVLQVTLTFAFTLLLLATNIRAQSILVGTVVACITGGAIMTYSEATVGTTLWNPFAWPNAVLLSFVGSRSFAMEAVVLLLALFATMPWTLRRVRNLHRAGAYRKTPVMVRGRPVIVPEQRTPQTANAEDAIVAIRTDPAWRAVQWSSLSFIERVIGLVLKPSEKPIAEILMQNTPNWGKNFRGLVWRFALFAFVGNLVEPETAARLVAPISSDLQAPQVALALLILLDAGLFVAMLLMISRLFFWYWWPEQSTGASGLARRFYRNFRLWPMNHFEVLTVIAKVNFVVALALAPLAILFGFSTPWISVQELLGKSFPWAPALLVIPWIASFVIPAQTLYPAFEEGWKWLRVWFVNEFVRLILVGLGILVVVSGSRSALAAALFAASAVGWFVWAGARYRRGN